MVAVDVGLWREVGEEESMVEVAREKITALPKPST